MASALVITTLASGCVLAPRTEAALPQAGSASRVILDEQFIDAELDTTVWNTCHWWDKRGCTIATNHELEWYLPSQVAVADGALHLTAVRNSVDGSDQRTYPFRSGMVTTGPRAHQGAAKLAWTYGSVEARLRVPAGRGLWPAMWMLPASSEARPEIDILEVLGHDPGLALMHLHLGGPTWGSLDAQERLSGGTFADGWRVVRLDWFPGLLVWSIDGVEVWRVSDGRVPDEPMYLVLNLAVGGDYPGSPDGATVFPATYDIDYIRITEAG